MADYVGSIIPTDYLYKRPVYYTSPFSVDRTNLIVKLVLNSTNFNFELARFDGGDFRLVDYNLGIGILKMWVAMWDIQSNRAVLFFKIPYIEAGASVIFDAYWGDVDAVSISDPDNMNFIFYEEFNSNLSSSKWSGTLTSTIKPYGFLIPNDYFTTNTNPLDDVSSWVIECGLYSTGSEYQSSDNHESYKFKFLGDSNPFEVEVYRNHKITHNIIQPGGGTIETVINTYGGLELGSYQEQYIAYYEDNDAVYFKLTSRDTYDDISYKFSRKVNGDSLISNISIGYRTLSVYTDYLNWLIIREYDDQVTTDLDGSSLLISHKTVNHQNQDLREFGNNIVSSVYKHESNMGGIPENLSNPVISDASAVWSSNSFGSVSGTEVIIYTGKIGDDLVSTSYKHYDSSHSYLYPASKLSDDGKDIYGRDYWRCTTTSGWAAIKFNSPTNAATFKIIGLDNYTSSSPRRVSIYGSNYYPRRNLYGAKEISSTTLVSGVDNTIYTNNKESYRYYIMNVDSTYGDIIRIKEWEMYAHSGRKERYYISQLRLSPATYLSVDENFPNEISLLGSVDDYTWYTLIDWTPTYTPFVEHYSGYGREQRYSIYNLRGCISFKLLCRGNWGATDGKIIIGSWGLYELFSESYTYRILDGTTNNIQQIWVEQDRKLNDLHKVLYLTNNKLNKVVDDRLSGIEELPEDYTDINVI